MVPCWRKAVASSFCASASFGLIMRFRESFANEPAANRRSLEPSASEKEKHMPLVRINLSRTASPKLWQTVSDVVYDAMITVAKVPADDKFQIFTGHAADELVFPKQGYLGIDYTDGI